jgi:SAM-dependent methyltransferase
MFSETTEYYDTIYSFIDYAGSTTNLRRVIEERTQGRRLLDIACGTGKHLLEFQSAGYDVEGMDLSPGMLEEARKRIPDVSLSEADMCDFDLGRKFDVITNNFSSIGYARTKERLFQAVSCVAAHLAEGGVALIEPWLTTDVYKARHVHMLTVDQPELKICRITYGDVDDGADVPLSILEFHYLIAIANQGVREAKEIHTAAMFSVQDFADAASAAGLSHEYIEHDDFKRGMHIFQ